MGPDHHGKMKASTASRLGGSVVENFKFLHYAKETVKCPTSPTSVPVPLGQIFYDGRWKVTNHIEAPIGSNIFNKNNFWEVPCTGRNLVAVLGVQACLKTSVQPRYA